MQSPINTLIVEDEIPAIEHLSRFIESDKRLRLVAVVKSVKDARRALKRYEVSLVFLDIKLRGSNGFDLIRDFPGVCTVVTTANSEFAHAAFDANAMDFLHKPFSQARFSQAIEKVMIAMKQARHQIFLRAGAAHGNVVINLSDVLYLQAEGKSVTVICGGGTFKVSQLLGDIEKRLPARDFIRVHRQYIVQKHRIAEISPHGRKLKISLRDHADVLPVGKTFVPAVKALFA